MRLPDTPPKHLRKASNKILHHIHYVYTQVLPCYLTSAVCVQNAYIKIFLQIYTYRLACILKAAIPNLLLKPSPSFPSLASRLTVLKVMGSWANGARPSLRLLLHIHISMLL